MRIKALMPAVVLLVLLPAISRSQEREPQKQIKSLMESCQFSQASTLAEHYLATDSRQYFF